MCSALRKIERNKLKQQIGCNNISDAWREHQIVKYGPKEYVALRNSNRRFNKTHYVGEKFLVDKNARITTVLNSK